MNRHPPTMAHLTRFVETLNDTHIDHNPMLPRLLFQLDAVRTGVLLGELLWTRYLDQSLNFDCAVVGQLLIHFQPASCDKLLQFMKTIYQLDQTNLSDICLPNALDECGFAYPLLLSIFAQPHSSAWNSSDALKTHAVAELLLTAQYRGGGVCNIDARKDCLFQLMGATQTQTLQDLFREHLEMTMFVSLTTGSHPIVEIIRLLLRAAPVGTSSQLSCDVIEHILCFALPTTPNMHQCVIKTFRSLRSDTLFGTKRRL